MKFTSWSVNFRKGKGWQGVAKYKDEDGRWKNKTRLFPDATGKRAAEAECEAWFDQLNEEAARPAPIARQAATVGEYMAEYVEGKVNVERSTAAEYRRIVDKLIAPTLGNISLEDLTPETVQRWVNALAKDYAAVTVKKALVLLRSAMTRAVDHDRLAKNPTRGVEAPKKPQTKPNALDERGRATVAAVLSAGTLSPAMLGVKIALYTGMREGEICGLRWRYVDLGAKTVTVAEALGHDGGEFYAKDPKTEGSRRVVYLPSELAEDIRRRHLEMREECMAAGVPLTGDMYVLGRADGSFMHPHTLGKKWKALAEALELVGTQGKPVTFHDLRHTYATAAIANGIDVKTVANSMGHANAAMTLNTYASPDPDAARRAAERMAETMGGHGEARGPAEVIEFPTTGTEG